DHRPDKAVRFTGTGPVADCDTTDIVPLDQIEKSFLGALEVLLGLGQVNRLILQEFSGFIDDGNLAPGSLPGIDSNNADSAGGWSQKQRPEVLFKNLDGFRFSALPQHRPYFVLNGWQQKPLERVSSRTFEQGSKLRLRIAHNVRNQRRKE